MTEVMETGESEESLTWMLRSLKMGARREPKRKSLSEPGAEVPVSVWRPASCQG